MPTEELQRLSVTFTEEAEIALAQRLRRLERQLRGAAVEEAVRARGTPGEVTSSDIHKAYSELFRVRRLDADYYRKMMIRGELPPDFASGLATEDFERHREPRRKTYLERMGVVYTKVGLIIAIGAPLFAMAAKLSATISHVSKETQVWLLVSAAGLVTALFGYLVRLAAQTWLEQKK
ncbi:MAG: hypothetical protein ABSF73_01900 [Terriglobia bacterium]|jgi:hypothetical protein